MEKVDFLDRKWLDVSFHNPHLVSGFRPSLISFLGFDLEKNPQIMGTGFFVGGNQHYGIVFTAKHVLEGLREFQKPRSSAPSALSEFYVEAGPSLDPLFVKAIWMGPENALMMNICYYFYIRELDIACCIVLPQEGEHFLPCSIPIDLGVPKVGDIVHMVSGFGMEAREMKLPEFRDGSGQELIIKRSVNIRIGTVTGVFLKGDAQYKFPHFTTSIPAEHGMSGGFVYFPEDGKTICACGIVSADKDITHEIRKDMRSEETSVISCIWPSLLFRIPTIIPAEKNTPTTTIFDRIKSGEIDKYNGDINNFSAYYDQNGAYRIDAKCFQ